MPLNRFTVLGPVLAAFLAGAGCAREDRDKPAAAGWMESVVVLDPVFPSRGLDFLPAAERYPAAGDPAEILPRLGPGRVLIFRRPARWPMHWWGPIADHIQRGGPVLFCGPQPFASRVRLENGRAVTEEAVASNLVAGARAAGLSSSVRTWRHANDSGEIRGAVRLAESGEAPWPAVEVEAEGFREWDLLSGHVPTGVVAAEENALAFYARGDVGTSRLFVEGQERDGSQWGLPVEVATNWAPRLLHQSFFRYLGGGRGRGGPGDGLQLRQVSRIRIGLDMARAPQSPGAHLYGLSEVRWAADPRPRAEISGWPELALVSPPCRRPPVAISALRDLERGDKVRLAAHAAAIPPGLPRGTVETASWAGRWIPLYGAEDEWGRRQGWPVSLFLAGRAGGKWRRWGWVALDPAGAPRPLTERIVSDAVRRLQGDLYFLYAGCPQWVYASREEIRVRACWAGRPGISGVGVAAELRRDSDGQVLRRAVLPAVPPDRPFEISLGLAAAAGSLPEDHRVVIVLEDLRRPGFFYDRQEQGIKVLPEKNAAPPPLGIVGGRFQWRGSPFGMAGVRYEPPAPAGALSWLDPDCFDPDAVRQDLRRLREAGHNTLFIECRDERQAEPLRYVAEEARRQEMVIVLALPWMDPLDPEWDRAERLLKAVRAAENPTFAALDIEWNRELLGEARRQSLGPAWRAWQAEAAGRTALPGEESYRLFLGDFASRRAGWIRRRLQLIGGAMMLTARMDADALSSWFDSEPPGSAHLDFLSVSLPGAGRLEPDWEAAAALAERARSAIAGRPLVWHGGPVDVGPDPRDADLSNQERWFDLFVVLVARSQAAGLIAAAYPAAGCSGFGEDGGLVGADGKWRPAGQVLQIAVPRFRRDQIVPVREARMEAGARFNAEWGRIQAEGREVARAPGSPVRLQPGQTLKAEVLNTGSASWAEGAASRVFVAVVRGEQMDSLPLRPLRRTEREWITWRAPESGDWVLQCREPDGGRFGEPLVLEVRTNADGER